ncbi:hypothetical protein LOZ14_005978 [Ophidiomyces ophidiicola]|nr:hypothetical protein LOZ14_005978 [Ophidiomyces ophidiicola]
MSTLAGARKQAICLTESQRNGIIGAKVACANKKEADRLQSSKPEDETGQEDSAKAYLQYLQSVSVVSDRGGVLRYQGVETPQFATLDADISTAPADLALVGGPLVTIKFPQRLYLSSADQDNNMMLQPSIAQGCYAEPKPFIQCAHFDHRTFGGVNALSFRVRRTLVTSLHVGL